MEQQSSSLMSAQIHFVNARFSLVHIPLHRYKAYLQPILRLIFPVDPPNEGSHQWANRYPFLNISITPTECSIVCLKSLAEELFNTTAISTTNSNDAMIFSEDLVVMSVEGEGLEAGKRVLELTSPLALAGISIFFITTYFSDYIIVPARSKGQVVRALEERGFQFEERAEAYVNPAARHNRNRSSTSSFGPSTPPPTTVDELQTRTFALLEGHGILPKVDADIRLLQCAGRRNDSDGSLTDEMAIQVGLTKCFLYQPRFLSLTLTENEAVSLLLDRRLSSNFRPNHVLLGNKEDFLIPIMLDLQQLPLEATGIVCGVAGKLAGSPADGPLSNAIEILYLSTARTGTVMVEEKDLGHALEVLRAENKNV
ncbi:MAG: hypothetical protein LQ349_004864 [Xanthoria aureola]|nr:MAG: hypothetical protein LQ349_004864 [Xanthoria aureola]